MRTFRHSPTTGVFIFLLCLSFFSPLLAGTKNVTTFAVIGDFGSEGTNLKGVSDLIAAWNVDFIITVGDNNYPDGSASTMDANVGQYFHGYIFPYTGKYGAGADSNRFFPALGNHDWRAKNAQPYLDYFTLPHNERYYDFRKGPVHFLVIDSDTNEPDGNTESSTQAQWLEKKLSGSDAPWKIVCFHHPPYSSGKHGSNKNMRWPFKKWGASLVLAGHDHTYERLDISGIPYIVNGLGGRSIYNFGSALPESQVRFNKDYGAMRITVNADSLSLQFITQKGKVVDDYMLKKTPSGLRENTPSSGRLIGMFLYPNYPNPFNPGTTFYFKTVSTGNIKIHIFNSAGAVVRSYNIPNNSSNNYRIYWNGFTHTGQPAPAGVYFYRVDNGRFSAGGKVLLIK